MHPIGTGLAAFLMVLFCVLILAAFSRWIFRINAIHARLEEIGVLLAELIKAVQKK